MKRKSRVLHLFFGYILPAALFAQFVGPHATSMIRIVANRITFAYDLEWMEGMVLSSAHRFTSLGNFYSSPSVEYVPPLYPPLFFKIMYFVTEWFADYYFVGRLIALATIVLSSFVIFLILKNRFDILTGIFGAFSVPSFYALTGFWFDIIRVDGLMLFLLLLLMWQQMYTADSWVKITVSSLLYLAAVLTKQAALVFAVPVVLYWILRSKYRMAVIQTVVIALFLVVSLLFMQWQTKGLFWQYYWVLGNSHPNIAGGYLPSTLLYLNIQSILTPYMWSLLAVAVAMNAVFGIQFFVFLFKIQYSAKPILKKLLTWDARSPVDAYLLLAIDFMIVMSWRMCIHENSFLNDNIPLMTAFLFLFVLAGRVIARIAVSLIKKVWLPHVVRILPAVMLSWFCFANLRSNIIQFLPNPSITAEKRVAVELFKNLLRVPSSVLAPMIAVDALSAWRKPGTFHGMSALDLRSHIGLNGIFQKSKQDAMNSFEVILDSNMSAVYDGYTRTTPEDFGIASYFLFPSTGALVSPRLIFIRKDKYAFYSKLMNPLHNN